MSEKEIAELRAENAKLRVELEELRDCSYKHFDLFTAHISEISDDVRDLFSYVTPMLYKMYPDLAETRRRVDQLLTRKSDKKDDPDKKSD